MSGPSRDGEVCPGKPFTPAAGEPLTVDVLVSNSDCVAGDYDAELRVDWEVRSSQTGTLGPVESETVTFSHRFEETSEYTLSIAGKDVAVSVRSPADVPGVEASTEAGIGDDRPQQTLGSDGPGLASWFHSLHSVGSWCSCVCNDSHGSDDIQSPNPTLDTASPGTRRP